MATYLVPQEAVSQRPHVCLLNLLPGKYVSSLGSQKKNFNILNLANVSIIKILNYCCYLESNSSFLLNRCFSALLERHCCSTSLINDALHKQYPPKRHVAQLHVLSHLVSNSSFHLSVTLHCFLAHLLIIVGISNKFLYSFCWDLRMLNTNNK